MLQLIDVRTFFVLNNPLVIHPGSWAAILCAKE